ncbi:MAG: penicillin-binding protein 2 [Coriobacteriia bacterium]|nr:penicillin-binding protein 2 [Coriobacteriia bacterium]
MAKRRTASPESRRFHILLAFFGIALSLIGVRLVWLHVVRSADYTARASNQRLRDIEISPRRGTIYDREGEPLAKSIAASTIFASPNTIEDKAGVAAALASVLGGKPADYEEKLSRDSGFVYIARRVDVDQAKQLEALKLTGIGFLDDSRRMYPSGELACQVLGFVGIDGEGLAGIEKRYDGLLAGKAGVLLAERDPYGRLIPGGVQKSVDAVDGHDIVLTIDKDIQYHAQIELARAVKKWAAKSGEVIVMNPNTGEIYAMASTPGFNPNNYGDAKPSAYRNAPVSNAYEPGSTIKVLTAAAVIEKGLMKPSSKMGLPSELRVAGRTIHESHGRGAVTWSLEQILTHSSNVGAVKVGMKLGKQGLYDSFSKFGLTEATGVDYPGEARGWLPVPSLWSDSSIANIPFGQGVSATPLQLCRAVSAIANGGELVTPHFLFDVPQDPSANRTWPRKRAISEKTALSTTKMMQKVVTEGTGTFAAVPGYLVAGKTGTAQVALGNGRGYASGTYIGSFIGYLPADDPQVLICVKLDQPRNAIYGGTIAAPVFSKLAQFSVSHLKIPPTTPQPAKKVKKKAAGTAGSKDVTASAGGSSDGTGTPTGDQ